MAKSQTLEKPQTLGNDILMRSIKILDIGYITVIYVIFSIICAFIIDKIIGKFDEKKESEKPLWRITSEMILAIWFYGVLIYVVRNLVELIPFPLDGYEGFIHKRVKESGSATVFTFTFLIFCDYFKNKIMFFYKTISNNKKKNGEDKTQDNNKPVKLIQSKVI